MQNHSGSSSSISCQFLVFESSLFQVISMKNQIKNLLFEGLCYNHKGLELFSKTNFESSWVFEGLKICKTMYFMLNFWFLASTFLVSTLLTYIFLKGGITDFEVSLRIQDTNGVTIICKVACPKRVVFVIYQPEIKGDHCHSKSATPPFK